MRTTWVTWLDTQQAWYDGTVARRVTMSGFIRLLVPCLVVTAPAASIAADEVNHRNRMPEPMLVESTTDIDSEEPGEVEVDVLGGRDTRGFSGSAEVEWRATRRLGLAVEVDGGSELTNEVGARASLAWALFHDFALDLHMQAFARIRLPFGFERMTPPDPTDAALPATMGIHAAFRRGLVNVRGEFGVEAGGNGPHQVSVRGAAAVLLDGGFGFVGLDLMGDLARAAPWAVALEAMLASTATGLPFRVGVAVPWSLARQHDVGVIVGIVAELN